MFSQRDVYECSFMYKPMSGATMKSVRFTAEVADDTALCVGDLVDMMENVDDDLYEEISHELKRAFCIGDKMPLETFFGTEKMQGIVLIVPTFRFRISDEEAVEKARKAWGASRKRSALHSLLDDVEVMIDKMCAHLVDSGLISQEKMNEIKKETGCA